ncbi:MAG: hypothetical protein OQK69_01635 [Gammaproteobacteria bacterium]|nr:hypothetical protein [Gammaproteobacteria bacterium]
MATKKDTADKKVEAKSGDDSAKDTVKKVEPAAASASVEDSPKTGFYKLSSILMAMIVAVPAGMIVAYVAMPDQLNEMFSTTSAVESQQLNVYQMPPQMPAQVASENFNRNQEPEWVAQQRAEMEKRRAEFDKKNAASRAAAEAEMPQWVKDQQAFMKKEQERQQEWAKRSAGQAYNVQPNMPGYMNNAGVNAYQQNPGQYYNGYPQPINPYNNYNVPYNAYGSYYPPYGWNGYPRRW